MLGNLSKPLLMSWLHKQGAKNKSYKKRWFLIENSRPFIHYFKNQGPKEKPAGSICLIQTTAKPVPSTNPKHWYFDIETGPQDGVPGRVYHCMSNSRDLAQQWIKTINDISQQNQVIHLPESNASIDYEEVIAQQTDEISNLKSQIKMLSSGLENHKSLVTNLRKQLEDSSRDSSTHLSRSTSNTSLIHKINSLTKSLDNEMRAKKTLMESRQTLTDSLADAQKQVRDLTSKIQSQNSLVTQFEADNTQLKADNALLKAQLDGQNEQFNELKGLVAKQSTTMDSIAKISKNTKKQLTDLQAEYSKLSTKNKQLSSTLETQITTIETLSASLDAIKSTSTNSQLEEELTSLRAQNVILEAKANQVDSLSEKIRELKGQT